MPTAKAVGIIIQVGWETPDQRGACSTVSSPVVRSTV